MAPRLKKYFKGDLTHNELKKVISISFPLYMAFIFVSLIFYPKEYRYSIWTHTMSYLGNYLINPGWIFFSLGVVFLAITTVPCIRFLQNTMRPINDWADKISCILYEIAWITMFGIGLLPDVQIDHWLTHTHVQVATISMIAYATAGALFWGRGRRKVFKGFTYFFGIVYYIALASMVITQLYARSVGIPYPGYGIFSFPFWEWVLFFTYLAFFYAMVLELANQNPVYKGELVQPTASI